LISRNKKHRTNIWLGTKTREDDINIYIIIRIFIKKKERADVSGFFWICFESDDITREGSSDGIARGPE
jgi:hypothetical protein